METLHFSWNEEDPYPQIGHLFFADDSLLFVGPPRQNAEISLLSCSLMNKPHAKI